jgi:hypothetical protein
MSAERVARNDAAFREANEKISETVAEHGLDGLLPFICECADPKCTDILQLTPEEYRAVRARSTTFINAHGHHVVAGPHVRVVEEYERYAVVEKVGRAGEIVKELDRRVDA